MTTNNNTKYTDLTQSKRLKEIGFEADADGYYTTDENGVQLYYSLTEPNFMDIETFAISSVTGSVTIKELSHWIKSYRLDTLLLALPEWCFKKVALEDSYSQRAKVYLNTIGIHFKTWAGGHTEFDIKYSQFCLDIGDILKRLFESRGPQAIAAAVDLICLLKEIEV